jgi:hypothetical protein
MSADDYVTRIVNKYQIKLGESSNAYPPRRGVLGVRLLATRHG